MDRPIESETTKIVENSYRATILAFLHEWSLFAEQNGVDLTKVIQAIKMRPTHSNMIFPGPGIGGYCLPKDGGLGYWAYRPYPRASRIDIFNITPMAIDINDTRALHVAELARDALRNMGKTVAGTRMLLCGASYREDVGDTRYSGSEIIMRKLTEMGALMSVSMTPTSSTGMSWRTRRIIRRRAIPGRASSPIRRSLSNIRVQQRSPRRAAKANAVVILAVRHAQYLELTPEEVVAGAGAPPLIVDCFGILSDEKIRRYFELGCNVKALGRGHLQRLKEEATSTDRLAA